jgi:hypothetical protein
MEECPGLSPLCIDECWSTDHALESGIGQPGFPNQHMNKEVQGTNNGKWQFLMERDPKFKTLD